MWDNCYLEVMAKYKNRNDEVEEYINLAPILKNLFMNREAFLKPIKKVRIEYVR